MQVMLYSAFNALNNWTSAMDQGFSTDIIYFDFSKVFNSVPHIRLLNKLKGYGVDGKLLEWFRCFLVDRYQCVPVNGSLSSSTRVTSGVPQGSVLGPLLFALYVNELPSLISSPLLMFADDIKLYRIIRSPEDCLQLQRDKDVLVQWSKTWLLSFKTWLYLLMLTNVKCCTLVIQLFIVTISIYAARC